MTTGNHEFKIERVFDAPRQLVWNAFKEPELVMQWWGPDYFTSPSVQIDFRVGGKYLYCMRGPDGTDYWSGGTYKEIVPLEKLVCVDAFANEHGEKIDPTSMESYRENKYFKLDIESLFDLKLSTSPPS